MDKNVILIITSLSVVLVVIVFTMMMKFWPKKGPMGINTKTTTCPRCGEKFPKIRKPASLKQALWGGYTCKNCGCETDKYGNEL